MDRVRVLRIYEFEGPRDMMEKQIANSVHGQRSWGNGCTIRAVTLGTYPEIMGPARDTSFDSVIAPNEAFEAKDWGTRGA